MTKAIRRESISVVVDGISYTGERIVKGTRSLSQRVIYKGITEHDGTRYKPHEVKLMDGIAEGILSQLVMRGLPGASWPEPK